MKNINKINTLFIGGLLTVGVGFTSCEDFLTVLPSNQITEGGFWQSKADLDNVRASAYVQMTNADVTGRILYWGELRSDNLTINDKSKENVRLLRDGVLHPTESMFDWSPFYKGINYCNKVLEKGPEMLQSGIDPSFREGDWMPIKAEMLSMRALYYFNLVRAYRNVPYVTSCISTDAEAMNSRIPSSQGVDILGDLLVQLEDASRYAQKDFSNLRDRKGRFTRRAVHALMADMYLWRGCMLEHSREKGDTIYANFNAGVAGDTLSVDSLNNMREDCYKKAIEHCDFVLKEFKADYEKELALNPHLDEEKGRNLDYPYMLFVNVYQTKGVSDNVYGTIWGNKNAPSESVFELQYDGNVTKNNTLGNYFSRYSGNNLSPTVMVGAPELTINAENNYNPTRGFGKADIRLLETFQYIASQSKRPVVHKNVAKSIVIPDLVNVTDESMTSGTSYRPSEDQDANWPFYRLTDIMLIKAEALARSLPAGISGGDSKSGTTEEQESLVEGFNLVNAIFQRCNPGLSQTNSSEIRPEDKVRMGDAKAYAKGKGTRDLLNLVYQERQREFIGEGKRWYDIVRQVEASNNPKSTLDDFGVFPKEVISRLRELYSMYVPIYSEEMKVNDKLVQNPVWDRYTQK